ncbi:thermonuclease family protein [Streptomyces sp. NPDC029006]|uniref:thermonuclease family protein n=1 Tax=Streptomyces sp. NPDC029006 TaxID=3155467 RepID=UPI0033DA3CCC
MYLYAARLAAVIDGDTIDFDIDLGFGIWTRQRIRLAGLNCPEHGAPDGASATAFTSDWLAQHASELVIRTRKDHREKYGRMLGVVLAGVANLNAELVASGHAVPYDGGRRSITAGHSGTQGFTGFVADTV